MEIQGTWLIWECLEQVSPCSIPTSLCPWWCLGKPSGLERPPGIPSPGSGPVPQLQGHPRGARQAGSFAMSSPRKWLTQRWRSALGMLQMVKQRCLMDSGCPDGSLEPVSSLSYFTPFSKIFATCKISPPNPSSEHYTPATPCVHVKSLSHIQFFVTPWTVAHQASLSFTISQSLLKLMSVELVMPSNHFILCHPLLLLPLIFPSIRVFSNESALHIRWPKYWSSMCVCYVASVVSNSL